MRYGRGSGGEKEEGETSSVGLAGVVGVSNPILSIEIGLRLKFNTKTMLSDGLFTDYAGLLGGSNHFESIGYKPDSTIGILNKYGGY